MRDFFAPMYELLTSLYGEELGQHLYGWNGVDWNATSLYVPVGIYMLLSTAFFAVLFYIILNKPNFSRWYHWFLFLGITFLLNWFLGFYLTYIDYDTGEISADIASAIDKNDIIMFGLANGIVSFVWFVIFSAFCRILNRVVPSIAYNTRDTPFPR